MRVVAKPSLLNKISEMPNIVDVSPDGSCPDGYKLSDDKKKCLTKESKKLNTAVKESESVDPDKDGKCPDGYELNDDKTKCVVKSNEESYELGHFDPQFVVNGTVDVVLENDVTIRFINDEEIELCENKEGNIQVGSSGHVLVIDSSTIVLSLLDNLYCKEDIEYEEKEVSIEDAIKSDISPRTVAEDIVRQFSKSSGSIKSVIEQSQSVIKIRARRKVRQLRSSQQKAKFIHGEAFFKTSTLGGFPKSKSATKVKTIRTTPKLGK